MAAGDATPVLPVAAKDHAFKHVSCTGAPNEVRVKIDKVANSVGLIVADLYRNDEAGYLKREGRVQQVRFAARAPVTEFCMHAPKPGEYAIALYHDKNANWTLDRGPFGIPAEPFGLSNNPPVRLAAPKIADTLFEVPADGAEIDIQLKG